jgi:hypothetical protein
MEGEYGEEADRLIREWAKPRPKKRKVARDERWREGVTNTKALLEAEYEIDVKNGANGKRPTDYEAMKELARIDCPEHPDDYPSEYRLEDGSLNPEFEREAANLIRTALSRLS